MSVPVTPNNSVFQNFLSKYPAIPDLLKWLLICTMVGMAAGSASALFLYTLNLVTGYREANLWIIIFLPVAGCIMGWVYDRYGKEVQAGNNLLIDTIHQPQQKTIPWIMAPFVYMGTIVTHLFGGSAGREGTALQMSAAIADQFSKPLRLNNADRSTLLIASLAGGFGSVFGTPLAGAIFALEVIMIGKLRYRAIFPAFAAAVIADMVTRSWGIPHTNYNINAVPAISVLNLLFTVVAGIVFGLCAALFSKLLHFMNKKYPLWVPRLPLRAFIGGLVIIFLVWLIDGSKYLGLGIPFIVQSFSEPMPVYDFALKILFTVLTLSAGFKGGEVTPLFFIGALLGNSLSFLLPLPMGLLTGMGFVAVFAAATNTPLACTVMAMELFGSECAVFVAIACVVAYLMSGHNSIYGKQRIGESKHHYYQELIGKRIGDI